MTSWTNAQTDVIATAVNRAPSVHNIQPWTLEFHDGAVSLFERLDLTLPRHDPTGRDRLLSCGAALTNLVLAVRVLGRDVRTELFPDPSQPDEVARVLTDIARPPRERDRELYAAIPWRRSHRGPFTPRPLPLDLRHALGTAATSGGAQLRPVRDHHTALAELFTYSALVLRGDRAYQRELAMWTNTRPDHRPGGGIPMTSPVWDTLPWAGLVRTTTALSDANALAARLSREYLLLVQTPDDGPADHVHAGRAIEEAWLAATHAGLGGSVLTQLLQVPEVRAGLIERLELPGFPQALLRFGYPASPAPHSPRVPVADLIRPEPEEIAP
jgi:nitroreductase